MKKLLKRIDPRVAQDLEPHLKLIYLGIFCVLVTALLTSSTLMLSQRAMKLIEAAGTNSELSLKAMKALKLTRADQVLPQLGWTCAIIVLVFALKYWFTRGQSYYLSKAAAALTLNIRRRLFQKLQNLPISYFSEKRQGALQSILTNDVGVYQSSVQIVRDSIDGPLKAILAFIFIIVFYWQLALITLLFIPAMVYVINRNSRKMKTAQRQVQDDLADLNANSAEVLLGTRVIKSFGAEKMMTDRLELIGQATFKSQILAARRFAQLRPLVELIGAVSLAIVLYVCGHLAKTGSMSIADIGPLLLALDMINQGARGVGNLKNTLAQVQAASDRIYGEVLELPDEAEVNAGDPLPVAIGDVEFQNVSFNYSDGTPAINDVSFKIPAGTSLALVGPSGAGKSTMADLLLRFYKPTSGQILIDGKDIWSIELQDYRKLFGVVPQQTFLFAGSIEDNLKMGKEDANSDEIDHALKLAHANNFVDRLENRSLTVLGERGAKISGGEGQRLAIARALVRNPKILIMDEATSNLDPESEKAITESLAEVMQNRTTLFIAHRLSTAVRADNILVLARGETIEYGSPQTLIDKDGIFAGMFRAYTAGMIDNAIG